MAKVMNKKAFGLLKKVLKNSDDGKDFRKKLNELNVGKTGSRNILVRMANTFNVESGEKDAETLFKNATQYLNGEKKKDVPTFRKIFAGGQTGSKIKELYGKPKAAAPQQTAVTAEVGKKEPKANKTVKDLNKKGPTPEGQEPAAATTSEQVATTTDNKSIQEKQKVPDRINKIKNAIASIPGHLESVTSAVVDGVDVIRDEIASRALSAKNYIAKTKVGQKIGQAAGSVRNKVGSIRGAYREEKQEATEARKAKSENETESDGNIDNIMKVSLAREGVKADSNQGKYFMKRITDEASSTKDMIDNLEKGKASEDDISAFAKARGWKEGATSIDELRAMAQENIENLANAGPTTGDWIWGNKVPQKAAGLGIGAGVLSSLFGNGQKSNSQLYSDPF